MNDPIQKTALPRLTGSPCDIPPPRAEADNRVRKLCVHENQRRHPVPLGHKLAGHLERDDAANTFADDRIWANGLKLANLADVVGAHLLDTSMREFDPIQAARSETVHGVLPAHESSKAGIYQELLLAAATARNQKQWGSRADLNRNEELPVAGRGRSCRKLAATQFIDPCGQSGDRG